MTKLQRTGSKRREHKESTKYVDASRKKKVQENKHMQGHSKTNYSVSLWKTL